MDEGLRSKVVRFSDRSLPTKKMDSFCERSSPVRCPWSHVLVLVVFRVCLGFQDLPSVIVAVLLCVEEAPPILEGRRDPRAKQAVHRGISIGQMPAGNLVVAIILEPGHAEELRIKSGGGVTALGQNANGVI